MFFYGLLDRIYSKDEGSRLKGVGMVYSKKKYMFHYDVYRLLFNEQVTCVEPFTELS